MISMACHKLTFNATSLINSLNGRVLSNSIFAADSLKDSKIIFQNKSDFFALSSIISDFNLILATLENSNLYSQ